MKLYSRAFLLVFLKYVDTLVDFSKNFSCFCVVCLLYEQVTFMVNGCITVFTNEGSVAVFLPIHRTKLEDQLLCSVR